MINTYFIVIISGNLRRHYRKNNVGERHDTPQNYMDELKTQITFSDDTSIVKIVKAMFGDYRILNRLSELMSKMASSVKEAYRQSVMELYNERTAKIKDFLKGLDSDYLKRLKDLDEYAKKVKQTSNTTGIGGK